MNYRNERRPFRPSAFSLCIINPENEILAASTNDWDGSDTRFQSSLQVRFKELPKGEYVLVVLPLWVDSEIPNSNKINVQVTSPGLFKLSFMDQ